MRRVTFSEITKPAIQAAFANPRHPEPGPGGRPAGSADHRPAGRLQAQPARGEQDPSRPDRGPCPERGRAAGRGSRTRDPGVHRGRVLDHRRRRAPSVGRRGIPGGTHPDRRGEDRHRFPGGSRSPPRRASRGAVPGFGHHPHPAPPGSAPAVHDQHPPAGGVAQAGLLGAAARCPPPSSCTRASPWPRARWGSSRTCEPTRSRLRPVPWPRRARSSPRGTAPTSSPSSPTRSGTERRGAQEAHEAIRPSSFARTPESVEGALKPDQARLYELIWRRALASQMAAAVFDQLGVDVEAGRYLLHVGARKRVFDGYQALYVEGRDEAEDEAATRLPELAIGEALDLVELAGEQHFTEPPPRFSEATLIRALEEHGIGRPSTYAPTMDVIRARGYVTMESRRLHPTEEAFLLTDMLTGHFADVVDPAFTARMENQLDEVAGGRREWVPMVRAFWEPFAAQVELGKAEIPKTVEETDIVCPVSGHPMLKRLGRNGWFLGCSGYPGVQAHDADSRTGGDDRAPRIGRGVPRVPRGHARRAPRTVRAVRGVQPLPGLQVHPPRGPAHRRRPGQWGDVPRVPDRDAGDPEGPFRPIRGMQPLSRMPLHPQARRWGKAGCRGRSADDATQVEAAGLTACLIRVRDTRATPHRPSISSSPTSPPGMPPRARWCEYRRNITAFTTFLAARGVDWRRPDRATVRAWLATLAERDLSASAVGSRVSAIRSFYRHAVRNDWIEANPMAGIRSPRRPGRLPRVLTVDEASQLVEAPGRWAGDTMPAAHASERRRRMAPDDGGRSAPSRRRHPGAAVRDRNADQRAGGARAAGRRPGPSPAPRAGQGPQGA